MKLLFISYGTNDNLISFGTGVHNYCDSQGIPNNYWLIQGAGHDWNVWKQSFWNFAQMACAAGFTDSEPQKPISAFYKIEAENYSNQSGIETEACSDTGGGQNVGFIENGDYVAYKDVDFDTGATNFNARAASNTSGGNIEIRLDSSTGTLVGTCEVPGTEGWQVWTDAKCSVSGVTGKHDLYLRFTGESDYLLNLNYFTFTKDSPTTTLGDLNGDGSVDALDYSMMKAYILGSIIDFPVESDMEAGDLNLDKAIDSLDLIILKQNILSQY